MTQWAEMPLDRTQTRMFHPTLDDMIPPDHSVRLFEEILRGCDWSAWEARYAVKVGQPAIHPRVVASAILYGLSHRMRSSRRLEWACDTALDFLWLVQGRHIDHATFCQFRTRFAKELKDLFGQVARVAMHLGLVRLNAVALDGTKVRANSSRHETATAESIDRRLAALDEEVRKMLAEAEATDARETDAFGEEVAPTRLPRELADAALRREALAKALEAARAKGAKVPVADPESTIQPNKEGGFAPNYTPMAAVDAHRGFIVEADVLRDGDEGRATAPMVDAVAGTLGERPKRLLADGPHGTGENLAALEARGVVAYIPVPLRGDTGDNPAKRADPTSPVAEADRPKLPRSKHDGKLDRASFVYDAWADCYYCPMGRRLDFAGVQDKQRKGGIYRLYRGTGCAGCPLARECTAAKGGKGRTVFRGEHEPLREATEARMKTEEGRAIYARRRWTSETPFGVMKGWIGLRQFLLRGLEKVKTEWLWACTAYNVWKLAREVARMRVRFAMTCRG